MRALKTLGDRDLKGHTVFVRLDLNVPIHNGQITSTARIDASLATLNEVLSQTNKVIVASHLGRPKPADRTLSLMEVGEVLSERLGKEVVLYDDWQNLPPARLFDRLDASQIVLLENLRFYPEETSPSASSSFAALSSGVDTYVFDAFGVAHRSHGSVSELPKWLGYDKCVAGWQMVKEYQALWALCHQPKKPLALVMGGAKIGDKLGAMLGLLHQTDHLIIGGAMAIPFLRCKGVSVGNHQVALTDQKLAEVALRSAEELGITLHLPEDHILASSFDASATPVVSESACIPDGHWALDMGPKTIERFLSVLTQLGDKGTVCWNGPMGVCEWPVFRQGSVAMAEAISTSKSFTVVGGGDSLTLLSPEQIAAIDHVSTGGGAMLAFFENPNLPGLMALYAES